MKVRVTKTGKNKFRKKLRLDVDDIITIFFVLSVACIAFVLTTLSLCAVIKA